MFLKAKEKEADAKKVTEGTIKKGFEIFEIIQSTYLPSQRDSVRIKFLAFSDQGIPKFKRLYNVGQKESDNIFAYWKNKKGGILCISYYLPGYDIQAPEDMSHMFRNIPGLSHLSVRNLDVSKTVDFTGCFANFGENKDSAIYGLERWNMQNGKFFDLMFYKAFPNNDKIALSMLFYATNFLKEASLRECFSNFAPAAKKVELYVDGWDIESGCDLTGCFQKFALQATEVLVCGLDLWKIHGTNDFSYMFNNFAPVSNYHLNLRDWMVSKESIHTGFAASTFFKIKEPKWAD